MEDLRRGALFLLAALMLCFGPTNGALAAPSNGTVVIANPSGSAQIVVVGTSTIKVVAGATVPQVEAQIVAKDNSTQSYAVTDQSNNPKASGAVATGDRLVVTAEDGITVAR